MASTGRRGSSDQAVAVYAAEAAALDGSARRFTRWAEVVGAVDAVIADDQWTSAFPNAPLSVEVHRRSRSASASLAAPSLCAIAIREGSWDLPTVLHELAHLAAPLDDLHGPDFCAALLVLVRDHCGFHAYGALRSAFREGGVAVRCDPDRGRGERHPS